MTLSRFALSFINALIVSAALLVIMYSLIYSEEPILDLNKTSRPIEISAVREESEVETIIVKPQEPKLVDPQPQRIKISHNLIDPNIDSVNDIPVFEPSKDIDLSINDGSLNLAFAVPPVYPARMATRGLEGFVVVGFSVSAAGAVFDPYIVEAEPQQGFNKAALEAIKRFKYQPRVLGGKAVVSDGQFYKFVFELEK